MGGSGPPRPVDVAVVGLGLIGAAALRHLALSGLTVAGVGSPEPADLSSHEGVFASHYDAGRITRRLDVDEVRSAWACRSIPAYADLEAATGLSIHRPVGCLFWEHDPVRAHLLADCARRWEIDLDLRPPAPRPYRWGEIAVPAGVTAVLEPAPAGFVDPRALRSAQLEVAVGAGATVFAAEATGVMLGRAVHEVRVLGGARVRARVVVLAAGPHTPDLPVDDSAIRVGVPPGGVGEGRGWDWDVWPMTVTPEAVVLGEVTAREAERIAWMPAVLAQLDDPDVEELYMVPATTYPDGRTYVKLGANLRVETPLAGRGEKVAWMSGRGHEERLGVLRRLLVGLCPDVDFRGWSTKPCMITDTPTGLPHLAVAARRLVVAAGGNGFAAKSSDAIGADAAALAVASLE